MGKMIKRLSAGWMVWTCERERERERGMRMAEDAFDFDSEHSSKGSIPGNHARFGHASHCWGFFPSHLLRLCLRFPLLPLLMETRERTLQSWPWLQWAARSQSRSRSQSWSRSQSRKRVTKHGHSLGHGHSHESVWTWAVTWGPRTDEVVFLFNNKCHTALHMLAICNYGHFENMHTHTKKHTLSHQGVS
jgi:hypothetical protein